MNKKTDKRLLASLDYIDDKFTERAAKRIKTRQVGVVGGVSKKRMVKYVAMLAACLMLLGAAIPIATHLINKLPNFIDPSASNPETTAPDTQPEEYFGDCFYTGVMNAYKYEGQFIYYVEETPGYYRIVKYNPETDTVSSVCLNPSCSHTYSDCPVAAPIGWELIMDGLGDWLIIKFSALSGDSTGPDGTKLCAYNLKTGESRTVMEKTQTGNTVKYASAYLPFEGKAYLTIREVDISDPMNKVSKSYITCYDPETDENVYMCDQPEGLAFIGITNKRFFFSEGINKENGTWSSNYKGENLKKEENFTFSPLAVSGTYSYDFSIYSTDWTQRTVYDLATDSTFVIDFGGTLKWFRVLEDKLLYVKYKSEDKTGGTEFWMCDKRGENRQLLLESEETIFSPQNCMGNYIIGHKTIDGVIEHFIFNIETGELKQISRFN